MPIPAGAGVPPALPSGPLVYDPRLSRVRLTASGLFDPLPVTVQRSTDLLRWSTVRGGVANPVGGVVRADDYEFTPDVTNHYRVLGPSVTEGFGTSATGGWGTPWVTSGGASSDYSVSSGTGRQLLNTVNVLRTALIDVGVTDGTVQADVTVPVTPTGASITGWLTFRGTGTGSYYAAELTVEPGGTAKLSIAKRVATVLTVLTSLVPLGSHNPTLPWRVKFDVSGSGLQAKAWQTGDEPDWQVAASDTDITSGTQSGLLSRLETGNTNGSVTVSFDNFALVGPQVELFAGSLVPELGGVWLKSVARPFLNRQVSVRDFGEVSRASRGGVFEVVGRSFPVAVTDVRGSRRWTMQLTTDTPQEADDLDLLLGGGDILFVHVPQDGGRLSAVPGGYVNVGDTRVVTPPTVDLRMRVLELPLVEVAAPGPDVVGATVTVQTVLNEYPTVQAMLDAQPTIASLLELVGEPTDVVVP